MKKRICRRCQFRKLTKENKWDLCPECEKFMEKWQAKKCRDCGKKLTKEDALVQCSSCHLKDWAKPRVEKCLECKKKTPEKLSIHCSSCNLKLEKKLKAAVAEAKKQHKKMEALGIKCPKCKKKARFDDTPYEELIIGNRWFCGSCQCRFETNKETDHVTWIEQPIKLSKKERQILREWGELHKPGKITIDCNMGHDYVNEKNIYTAKALKDHSYHTTRKNGKYIIIEKNKINISTASNDKFEAIKNALKLINKKYPNIKKIAVLTHGEPSIDSYICEIIGYICLSCKTKIKKKICSKCKTTAEFKIKIEKVPKYK